MSTKLDICQEFYYGLSDSEKASAIGLHLRCACAEGVRIRTDRNNHRADAIGLRCMYEMREEEVV